MTPRPEAAPLRVLVVDDSAYNRQTITSMLESRDGVEVVGRATNGKEALKLAFDLEPDVITLDLEMPEMDGFSFLRLLMSRRPIPVLVISGYAQRDNVFRALELGAMDFIAKPRRHISPDIRNIEDELASKIAMVRRLQSVRLKERAAALAAQGTRAISKRREEPATATTVEGEAAPIVVGIGASTGGPPAIQQLLAGLPADLSAAVVISQHMPARFTKAFAARLDKVVDLRVVEAADGQPICRGVVYVVPGSSNLEVVPGTNGSGAVRLVTPQPTRAGAVPLTPSADHMLKSLAAVYTRRLIAVILTGMGSDGTNGTIAARRLGAHVLVEDPKTAVMPGMPHSALEAGSVDRALPLERLHEAIIDVVNGRKRELLGE